MLIFKKIYGYFLKTYSIIIATFKIFDKIGCLQFFQKIILLADISIELVFGMFFLIPSNADI